MFAIIVCGTLGTLAIHLSAPRLLSPSQDGSASKASSEAGDGRSAADLAAAAAAAGAAEPEGHLPPASYGGGGGPGSGSYQERPTGAGGGEGSVGAGVGLHQRRAWAGSAATLAEQARVWVMEGGVEGMGVGAGVPGCCPVPGFCSQRRARCPSRFAAADQPTPRPPGHPAT